MNQTEEPLSGTYTKHDLSLSLIPDYLSLIAFLGGDDEKKKDLSLSLSLLDRSI
jgi:hypothetical protein